MYQPKLRRHSIFFIVVLLHLGVFFSWQYGSKLLLEVNRQPKQHRLLHLIYLPAQNKVPLSNSATSNPAKTPQKNIAIKSTRIKRLSALSISSPNQIENKIENKTEEQTKPTPANETIQRPLQRNIAELTQSLKADFQQQEKRFKPKTDPIKQFGNAVADAARIQREGVILEKKFAYDGRPVSKVKTPYGTYCVRHPKAGEKLELSPPPLPVTCGEL